MARSRQQPLIVVTTVRLHCPKAGCSGLVEVVDDSDLESDSVFHECSCPQPGVIVVCTECTWQGITPALDHLIGEPRRYPKPRRRRGA